MLETILSEVIANLLLVTVVKAIKLFHKRSGILLFIFHKLYCQTRHF